MKTWLYNRIFSYYFVKRDYLHTLNASYRLFYVYYAKKMKENHQELAELHCFNFWAHVAVSRIKTRAGPLPRIVQPHYVYDPRALYHILVKVRGVLHVQFMKPDISSGSVRLRGERRIYRVRVDFGLLFRTKPLQRKSPYLWTWDLHNTR